MKNLAWALLVIAACTAPSQANLEEVVMVLEVAPQRATCLGEAQGMCLQVREPGTETWQLFYDPIEGFDHEAGVRYVLEIARRPVPNPPADGSSFAYRLLRILEREPEPAGGG